MDIVFMLVIPFSREHASNEMLKKWAKKHEMKGIICIMSRKAYLLD